MQIIPRTSSFAVVLTLVTSTCAAADWKQFRGPNGAGISADTNVPVIWSETENLRWLVYRERVSEVGGGGRPVYASSVVANGKIHVPIRWHGVLVLSAKPKYDVLAQNRFASDDSNFDATPAISNGDLFLRSNRFRYWVAKK